MKKTLIIFTIFLFTISVFAVDNNSVASFTEWIQVNGYTLSFPDNPGDIIEQWAAPNGSPMGIDWDADGDFIWHASENAPNDCMYKIQVATPHNIIASYPCPNPYGIPDGGSMNGACVANGYFYYTDFNGDLSVVDDHIVQVDRNTLAAVNQWVIAADIDQVLGITYKAPYFYVVCNTTGLIYEVDLQPGGVYSIISTITAPGGGALSGIHYLEGNDTFWIANFLGGVVYETDSSFNILQTIPAPGGANAIGITWPGAGENYWLTDFGNDQFYIIDGDIVVSFDPPEISVTPSSMTENLNVDETSTQILTIENIGPAGAQDLNAVITIETSAEEYFQSFLQFPQYEQRDHIATERTARKIKNGYPDKFQQLTEQLDNRSIIFSDDMEGGVGGWTTQVYGVDDLWHQTNLGFNSPVTSWWCGIEAQGNYATGNTISTALVSAPIDLTTISGSVGLDFYEFYDTEPGVDFCMVDVTTDGGSNWTPLRGGLWTAPSGNSGGWIFTALDLTPYLGNMLQIRFYFDTVDHILNDYAGWFIDDVQVTVGAIFNDDMESGVGGWTTQVYNVDDLWHQTNLSFNSPVTSWWCGIEAQGNYETGNTISTALISPAIDLTTISLPVGLYFYESYDTEGGYDYCMVDVTIDGGSNWTPLRGGYGSAPSGYSGGWIFTALDLTPYLGNMLQIRFYFDTGDPIGNTFAGWFIDDVLVTTGDPLVPWLSVDPNNVTIPAQSFSDINVNFDTSGMFGGIYTANIVIDSNDPVNPQVIVPVTLNVTGIPDIAVDPTSLDFGSLFVGNSTTEILTVLSSGSDDLEVTDITSDNPDFYPDITAFTLPPTINQEIIVTFIPSSVGTITGTLTIYSNDPDTPEVYVPLSGVGLAPPEIVVTPANLEEYLLVGETSTQLLNIENTGAADLQFTLSHEYLVEVERSISRNYGDYADRSRINTSVISLSGMHSTLKKKGFSENRAAGDILGTYTGMPISNLGMVWVEDLLYVVHYEMNQLVVYDISTQSVIAAYTIHSLPFGITWDGMYLWIGDISGNVYAYNLDGSSAGFSFSCPDAIYPTLTWDGNYFLTSPFYTLDPTIYKLDATGAIIDSYTGSSGTEICQIVWVPEHTDGNLWMTDRESIIAQLDLTDTDGTYTVVSSFPRPAAETNFAWSITHHNFNLWWSDYDGPLYEIDDGISEIDWWFGYNPYTGTVPAGTSQDVTCFFVATDLYGGEYYANLIIDTNVPTNPQVIVPVMLDVTGIPDIDVLPVSLDFGAQFAGGTYEDIITIFNYGNDELVISDITSDNADFSTDVTTLIVPYGETADVTVYFSPTTIGVISGTLTIYSDDPDEPEFYIALTGEGTEPPDINVSPLSFDDNLMPNEFVDHIMTIENLGLVDLDYSINIEYQIPTDQIRNYGDYADRSRENSAEISLPDSYSTSMRKEFNENRAAGDVLGTYTGMPANNTGMVWVGDLLYVIDYGMYQLAVYDISTQSVIATYPLHSEPLGITWDGMYLWIGDGAGNVYAYNLDGSSAGYSFSCPDAIYPCLAWDGNYFVTCPFASIDPTIYKLDATGAIIDSYNGSIGMPLYQIVWVPEHSNGNLWITNFETQTIAQLNLTDTDGTYAMVSSFTSPDPVWNTSYAITHHNFNLWWSDWDGPLYEIDDGIVEIAWLSIDINSGIIPGGGYVDITLTVDANETDSLGVYEANLAIYSNDPDEPVVYIPVTLTVNYPPEIVLPDDFTFEEDGSLMVDFDQYITDPNSSAYVLYVSGNTNVIVDIVGSEVTFGAVENWYGTETLTFTVDDGQTDSDDVDIIVTPVNDPPTIVLPDNFTFEEDDQLVEDFTSYIDDIDGDPLTLSVSGNTDILVSIDGAEVTFGATTNWNGSEILTFTVDDGVVETVARRINRIEKSFPESSRDTASDDVEVIVTPLNDPPTIVLPDNFTFEEDGQLVEDFIPYIDDVDGDPLTLSVSGNTEILVSIDDAEVTFGATSDWNGSEILTFTVDDGVVRVTRRINHTNNSFPENSRDTASDDVEVIVTPVNDPPVLIGFLPEEPEFTVLQDSMVTFSVDVEDIDSTIDYEWYVDGALQTETSEEFEYIFATVGDVEIECIASDEDYEIVVEWLVHVEPISGVGLNVIPLTTVLYQNFPNPFNPTTTINLDIKQGETGKLSIFNVKGQVVLSREFGEGAHQFEWNASSCSSGMYFYKLKTQSYAHIRKMIMMK